MKSEKKEGRMETGEENGRIDEENCPLEDERLFLLDYYPKKWICIYFNRIHSRC